MILKENFTSENLYNKIKLLTEQQQQKFIDSINWTSQNYDKAVLIGGTAVIYYLKHGRDLTPDIDFLIDNISDLESVLEDHDLKYSNLLSEKGVVLGITVDVLNTDFLNSMVYNPYLNKLILKDFDTVEINNCKIRIIKPELLCILKLELGRQKDTDDGIALLQSGVINKDLYTKYCLQLKPYLKEFDSIITFSEIII